MKTTTVLATEMLLVLTVGIPSHEVLCPCPLHFTSAEHHYQLPALFSIGYVYTYVHMCMHICLPVFSQSSIAGWPAPGPPSLYNYHHSRMVVPPLFSWYAVTSSTFLKPCLCTHTHFVHVHALRVHTYALYKLQRVLFRHLLCTYHLAILFHRTLYPHLFFF